LNQHKHLLPTVLFQAIAANSAQTGLNGALSTYLNTGGSVVSVLSGNDPVPGFFKTAEKLLMLDQELIHYLLMKKHILQPKD
jgi:hypothetical protein